MIALTGKSLGLYVTNTCNRSCAFCFKKHGYPRPMQISLADLSIFCDWCSHNNIGVISLAGGEPTTHPEFPAVVRMVHEKVQLDFPLAIITNLLCEPEKVEAIHNCLVLANADSLDQYTPENLKRFQANLKRVSEQSNGITLSITLWHLDQPTEHLLQYCQEFRIPYVRFDLARASILKPNIYVKLDQLEAFKMKILEAARPLVSAGVKIGFDCPLPFYMFTEDELREIGVQHFLAMNPAYHMCEHIYINPDLTISACPHQLLLDRRLDTFKDYSDLFNTVFFSKLNKLNDDRADQAGAYLCEAERFLSRDGQI